MKSFHPPRRLVARSASASLWDIGDGAALLELEAEWGQIDPASLELIEAAPVHVASGFRALVIASSDPRVFSAGASADFFIPAMESGDWPAIDRFLLRGQTALSALRHAPFPAVASAHGRVLGGGLELALHLDGIVCETETRFGFPERWSGIIPGWSGAPQMLLRRLAMGETPAAAVGAVFELVAGARLHRPDAARALGILRDGDILAEPSARTAVAKTNALALSAGYSPPGPATLQLAGSDLRPDLSVAIEAMIREERLAPAEIAASHALADLLCAGDTPSTDQFMARERAVFLDLARHPDAAARMRTLVATGRRPPS